MTTFVINLTLYTQSSRCFNARTTFQTEIQRQLFSLRIKFEHVKNFVYPFEELLSATKKLLTENELNECFPPFNESTNYFSLQQLVSAACQDENVFETFAWCYPLHCSSADFLALFLNRFQLAMSIDTTLSRSLRDQIPKRFLYWVTNVFPQIPESLRLKARTDFLCVCDCLLSYGFRKIGEELKAKLDKPSARGKFRTSSSKLTYSDNTKLPLNFLLFNEPLDFLSISPFNFAHELTKIQSELFFDISAFELFKWNKEKGVCKGVSASVNFFNRLQNFLIFEILDQKNIEERVKVVTHIILILEKCYSLFNFDAVVCIVTLFNSAAIHRLKNTFSHLTDKTKSILEMVSMVVSPQSNWAQYRQILRTSEQKSVVPYLGLFLSDVLFTDDGSPSKNKKNEINFEKSKKMGSYIESFDMYQRTKFDIPENSVIRDFMFKVQNMPITTDKERFDKSRSLEKPSSKEIERTENLVKEKVIVKMVNRKGTIETAKFFIDDIVGDLKGYLQTSDENLFTELKVSLIQDGGILDVEDNAQMGTLKDMFSDGNALMVWQQSETYDIYSDLGYQEMTLDTTLSFTQQKFAILRVLKIHEEVVALKMKRANSEENKQENVIDSFLDVNKPIGDVIKTENTLLLIPLSKTYPSINEQFLCGSLLDRFELKIMKTTFTPSISPRTQHEENTKNVSLVHADPFIILKTTEKVIVFPLDSMNVVYNPTKERVILTSPCTDFNIENPLELIGDKPLMKRIVSLYHKAPAMTGVELNRLNLNHFGVHQLLFDIINEIFSNRHFFDDNYWDKTDLIKAQEKLLMCELGEFVELDEYDNDVLLGMLVIYLQCLDKPLFGDFSGELSFVKNAALNERL
ncbi:guanine nucleotide exchange factor, putative [Entamoeba invadens IP1]|uniref:Guanine nucleotide exchange factor, putative n=1 Tax=Entamoeba invadens IP1 TaxID=370355 RepID=A0A0A1U4Q6_ENTIV|nr:guanine nucleotide exchange factor, putative [Entamoeba invadens IP1]ELP89184.1 guanine nucleotide exchange factor, putative [Entamoeba invadens IP1]|eukprot:XP_004255955.1 guanine nucleotide exchange factor, putative [Entamoeba invadens IP1]